MIKITPEPTHKTGQQKKDEEQKAVEHTSSGSTNKEQQPALSVSETAACYTPQKNIIEPCISPLNPCSCPETAINTPEPDTAEKLVTIKIRTVKNRKELAYTQPRLHTKKFSRWYQIPELQNKLSLEIMLDEYRDVTLVAYVLNCSKHMVYTAMEYHNITYPRAYSSKRTEQLLDLPGRR